MTKESEEIAATAATVVVGTYDGGLLGFGLEDGAQRFGYAPHVGCVKALHCTETGKLATGATDNAVRLFDLAKGVEMGELQEHEDSVSAVQFWGSSLITGSSDGQVCIWRCGDYELLLKFRGHKAAVTCLAIHPSGRMMASAGRDQRIQLWDLIRGTSAAHLSVPEAMEVLDWSPDGKSIACLSPRELVVVEVTSNSVASYKDPNSAGFMRVSLTAVAWLSSQLIALGDGRGLVQIFRKDAEMLTQVCRIPRDDVPGRIKALLKVDSTLLVGLSTGQVEVWSFDAEGTLQESHFKRLRVVDTKSRLTCLAVWAPGSSQVAEALATGAGKKAKRAGTPQSPKTGELPVQKAEKRRKVAGKLKKKR
mmetsp:Transcript_12620/g.21642  ORF Transcript_12620/g.21642 Transcript_12620/m.21642 type:complete len:364 (-) Transcript_12620:72-1163(-)